VKQIWLACRVCFITESATRRRADGQSAAEIRSSLEHQRRTTALRWTVRWLLHRCHLHSTLVVGKHLCHQKFLGQSHVRWQGSQRKRSFSSISHAGKFCKSWAATRIRNQVLIFAVVSRLVSIIALPSIMLSVTLSVVPQGSEPRKRDIRRFSNQLFEAARPLDLPTPISNCSCVKLCLACGWSAVCSLLASNHGMERADQTED
jgi:hypothetical protein